WVLIAGTLAYAWTFLVFFGQGRFPVFAALETFLLAALYYKILSFARSSEEIALQAGKLTPLLIGLTAALFLIHVLVLYFAAFSRRTPDRASDEQKAAQSKIKSRREIVVFSALALALAIVLAFVVPPDFVSHDPVWKQLEDEPPPQGLQGDLEEGQGGRPKGGGTQNGKPLGNRDEKYPSELQNRGQGQGEQNGEGQGGRPGERQGPGGQGKPDDGEGGGGRPDQGDGQGQSQQGQGRQYKNKLKGVPSDKWDQFQQSGGGKGNQSAVMIIASDSQPVYAAAEYLGKFDPVEGFQYNPDELLNRLRDRRLLETWQDPNPVRHPKRTPVEIYYLSTIPQRVLAFRPFSVEPTILQKKYHPFDLSYTATSAISLSNPKDWADIPEPTPAELSEYKEYLEVNLPAAQKARLKQWVQSHMGENGGYFARLNAILQGYRDYRYKMGFSEDSSVAAIEKFLFQTKEGDCTEFANATALLARIAGIPARVVTGYIASKDLQTPAHRGG
ncbi:MAG: transglutaminase domain-containing protein, partial [Leptospiraceae bacterium]|nr:transglutaminase domain-containing protein [Leptospiraceae bacterium]